MEGTALSVPQFLVLLHYGVKEFCGQLKSVALPAERRVCAYLPERFAKRLRPCCAARAFPERRGGFSGRRFEGPPCE